MARKLPLILLLTGCFLSCCMSVYGAFNLKKVILPARFDGVVITKAVYDRDGFIWFLTNGGLHRYDGNQVISFNYQSNPVIDYAAIRCMMADKHGNLWLGGDNGLIRFNLISWKATQLKVETKTVRGITKSIAISTIFETGEGVMLAGTTDGRLFKVEKDSLVKIFDTGLSLSRPDSSSNFEMEGIVQDDKNSLWLRLSEGYLIHLRLSEKLDVEKYKIRHFSHNEIFSMIYAPSEKRILFSLYSGVYALDCQTHEIDTVFKKPSSVRVFFYRLNNHIYRVRSKLDDNGTMIIYPYPGNKPEEELSLPSGWFDPRAQRKNKIIVSDGISLYELIQNKESIRKYLYDAKHYNSIRSFFKTDSNQLLVSCYYKTRLLLFNTTTDSARKMASMLPYTFLPWNSDSVLIGDEGRGLFWYMKGKGKIVPIPLTADAKDKFTQFDPSTVCLERETDTTVWVGSFQGLVLVNPYRRTYKNPLQGDRVQYLNDLRVSAVLPVQDKRLLATSKGLFYFNLSDHQVNVFSRELKERMVYCLQLIGDQVWAGSSGMGLVVMDDSGKVIKRIDRSQGLAGNTVFSLKYWHGYLIAGTDAGLSIIRLRDMQIKNFTINDGLPSNECNYSALLVTDDEAYLGTTNGMAIFNVAQLYENKHNEVSPFNISVLKMTNQTGGSMEDYTLPYKQPSQIDIPAGTAVFSITISNENHLAHLQKTYYRLSKEDPWNEIANKSTLSFVNMPPGKYHLELAGKTTSGTMIEGLYQNLLMVTPFYYQTLWFKILVALLALALIVLIARFIVKLREKNTEKERLIRLQIAGDLHDEVGSTLAGISMQADLLLHGHRENQDEYLRSIAERGRSAVNTMGDIVWSIDPRNDDHLTLVHRLKQYGEKTLGPAGINITFRMPAKTENPLYMPQKTRQNIMLIYKEALTNICKHAGATRVGVSFSIEGRYMKLVIADNGKGLPEDHSGGHGLRNMRMRANAIGAQLYFPKAEAGMVIVLQGKI